VFTNSFRAKAWSRRSLWRKSESLWQYKFPTRLEKAVLSKSLRNSSCWFRIQMNNFAHTSFIKININRIYIRSILTDHWVRRSATEWTSSASWKGRQSGSVHETGTQCWQVNHWRMSFTRKLKFLDYVVLGRAKSMHISHSPSLQTSWLGWSAAYRWESPVWHLVT
jgi:hypothetical protein